MPTPKIELKSIKTFQGREGYGLNADLFVNGKKICFVRDDGNGGCVDFDIYGKTNEERASNRAVLSMVETYAKGLPEKEYPQSMGGGTYQPDLETLINDLLEEKENKKAEKKMQKKMETHIILGVPNADSYRWINLNSPLKDIPTASLQLTINQIKPRLKRGEVFLNTNLEELGVTI